MSILKSSRIPDKSKHRAALKKCVYFLRPCHGGAPLEIVYRIFRSLDVCATSAVTDFYKRVEKRPIRPIFRVKILLYHAMELFGPLSRRSVHRFTASVPASVRSIMKVNMTYGKTTCPKRFKTTLKLQLIMYFLSFHFFSPK